MGLVALAEPLDDPAVGALLAHAIGNPTPERLESVLDSYRKADTLFLLGHFDGDTLVGCIGVERTARQVAIVKHIAVAPGWRGQGSGRAMLDEVGRLYRLRELRAETHAGAVEFYRRCGFQVMSLGELYPGVERFQCVKRLDG